MKRHILSITTLLCITTMHGAWAQSNEIYTNIGGNAQQVYIQQVGGTGNYLDVRTANSHNGLTITQNGSNIRSNVYGLGNFGNAFEFAAGTGHQIYMLDQGNHTDIQAQTAGANNYIDAKTLNEHTKLYTLVDGQNNISMISGANTTVNPAGAYVESVISGNANRTDNNVNNAVSNILVGGDANKAAVNITPPSNANLPQNTSYVQVQGNTNVINSVVQGQANAQAITTVGNTNQAYTNVAGNSNLATIQSQGTQNAIAVNQAGNANLVSAQQSGQGNIANITQSSVAANIQAAAQN